MKIQLLISSIKGRFPESPIAKHLPSNADYIVINQRLNTSEELSQHNVYNYNEMGLSKSRNRALEIASGEVCWLLDDDAIVMDSALATINEAFIDHPDADILTFIIQTPEGEDFRKYSGSAFYHTPRSLLQVSSIEVAFKLESVKKAGLNFDENFGLNSRYPVGEENIFLLDALNAGLTIKFIPLPIVTHPRVGTGLDYKNKDLFIARGAFFVRAFGWKGVLFTLIYFVKNFKRLRPYQKPLTLFKSLLKGNWLFLKNSFSTSKNV